MKTCLGEFTVLQLCSKSIYHLDGWTDGQTDGWIDRLLDRRTNAWMDGRTDG